MIKNLVSLLILVALFALANHNFLPLKEDLAMFVMINDSQSGAITLYQDIGRGFNQADSETKRVGKYEKQLIKFTVSDAVTALRFDPDMGAEALKIEWIRVGYLRWPFSEPLPFGQFKPANQITSIDPYSKNGWYMRFENGANDPYLFPTIDEAEWTSILGLRAKMVRTVYVLEGSLLLGLFSSFLLLDIKSKR